MKDTAKITVLLADDDKDDRFFFERALKEISPDIRLTAVDDGEELMKYLSNELEELPTVLFLDLNMPLKDGYECLEEIQRIEKFKSLPIIIYSTHYDETAADRIYKGGAHAYICKPDSYTQLKKTIEDALIGLF